MNKRLVFVVEGDTEIKFVENSLIPYFCNHGINNTMHAQTIATNRKIQKKGGNVSYGKYSNEIRRTLNQSNVIVTSIVDYFKLPVDFPGYTNDSKRIDEIEKAISEDIDNSDFIPYIQRHEIEALMFSDRSGFDLVIEDPNAMKYISQIIDEYPNPEDINGSAATSPSKRLEAIYNYDKVADGDLIFEMIDFNLILAKCPRFKVWIDKLMHKLSE